MAQQNMAGLRFVEIDNRLFLEHKEEAVCEVAASLADAPRYLAKAWLRQAIRRLAAQQNEVTVSYDGDSDVISILCPVAGTGPDEAARRVTLAWDTCWDWLRRQANETAETSRATA